MRKSSKQEYGERLFGIAAGMIIATSILTTTQGSSKGIAAVYVLVGITLIVSIIITMIAKNEGKK